jgi:hypothetical protein
VLDALAGIKTAPIELTFVTMMTKIALSITNCSYNYEFDRLIIECYTKEEYL